MTKRKLSLIIIAAVLGAILIAVSVCAIIANSKNDKSQPVEQLASWQSMARTTREQREYPTLPQRKTEILPTCLNAVRAILTCALRIPNRNC